MRNVGILVLMILATACRGEPTPTIPPPDGAPTGSLLVLETRPCNWLQQPDPNACDPVGLARIGLDGQVQEVLTPELPMAMNSMALSHDREQIAWTASLHPRGPAGNGGRVWDGSAGFRPSRGWCRGTFPEWC